MRPILVTPPTDEAEPVSIAEVREHLHLTDTVLDSQIRRWIRAARQWCEEFLQRSLAVQTLEFALDAFPSDDIEVPMPPLVSVTSITYLDEDGELQTLGSSEYALDKYSEPGWLMPAAGGTWPQAGSVVNAAVIRYVAGYPAGTVPEPICIAILMLTGHFSENREATSFGVSKEIELGVRALIQPYRLGMGV